MQWVNASGNVGGWADESVSNAISASSAGREPLSAKRRHFMRFTMAAVTCSVRSRLLRDLSGFECDADFWLLTAFHCLPLPTALCLWLCHS
jgi:hypothetical protein